jgi:hypothetical protein
MAAQRGRPTDALNGIEEVLMVGDHTSLSDFRHYVEKHRSIIDASIIGYEVVDHPSENELVALAQALRHIRSDGRHPDARNRLIRDSTMRLHSAIFLA